MLILDMTCGRSVKIAEKSLFFNDLLGLDDRFNSNGTMLPEGVPGLVWSGKENV